MPWLLLCAAALGRNLVTPEKATGVSRKAPMGRALDFGKQGLIPEWDGAVGDVEEDDAEDSEELSIYAKPYAFPTKIYGGFRDVAPHSVASIGECAVAEYNRRSDTSLELMEIRTAQQQLVSGMKYSLCLATSSFDLHATVYVPHKGETQYAFSSPDDGVVCPDTVQLPSLLEVEQETSYLRMEEPAPSTDSFDLREEHPACTKVLNQWIDQGHCGSCAAIALLTALRDMHCIYSVEQQYGLADVLSMFSLDISRAMTCAAEEDSTVASSRTLPYRSSICEGSMVHDLADSIKEHGMSLTVDDTYHHFTSESIVLTRGTFLFEESIATGALQTLRCESSMRTFSHTAPVHNSKITLFGNEGHLARCKPNHSKIDLENVVKSSFGGQSAAFKCEDSIYSIHTFALSGYNAILPVLQQMKHAIRFGPIIAGILWYDSWLGNADSLVMVNSSLHGAKIYGLDEAAMMTEQQKEACRSNQHCDFPIGSHAVAIIGWEKDFWIVRNSYTRPGKSGTVLLSQSHMDMYLEGADSLFLDEQDPCQAVLPQIIVDDIQVDELGELQPIVAKPIGDKGECSFRNPNVEHNAKITYFDPFSVRTSEDADVKATENIKVSSGGTCCPLKVEFSSVDFEPSASDFEKIQEGISRIRVDSSDEASDEGTLMETAF